jgi:hypothetical protein
VVKLPMKVEMLMSSLLTKLVKQGELPIEVEMLMSSLQKRRAKPTLVVI